MVDKLGEIFSKVEELLAENPGLTRRALSEELAVARDSIESAVRKATGISFNEYRADKRLEQTLAILAKEGKLQKTTRS